MPLQKIVRATFYLSCLCSMSALSLAIIAADSTPADRQDSHRIKAKPAVQVKVLRADELKARQNGKKITASLIEVTFAPQAGSPPHRHPGPVSGYVVEGTLEFQIGDRPLQTLKAGDTFFEPAMILHRVSRNPDPHKQARIIVTMIHPANAKQLVIPEPAANESTR